MQTLPAPVAEWLKANHATNTFAASLNAQYERKGVLSVNQIAAVERSINARADAAKREENAPVAVIARIEEAFNRAREAGLLRPKLVIGSLHFSPAVQTGRNPGAIYAKDRDEGTYLGKFAQGRFVRSRDCDDEKQAMLLSIAADPLAAAVNHGKLTGACSVCMRKLSDKVSVARGIGPICAAKFGW